MAQQKGRRDQRGYHVLILRNSVETKGRRARLLVKKMKFGLILFCAVVAVGCSAPEEKSADLSPKMANATILPGTPVKLMLLEPLSSDGSDKGQRFSMVLKGDLESKEVIPLAIEGTKVEGEVVFSRGAGAMSSLTNEPARLQIRADKLKLNLGGTVELVANLQKPDEPYSLTRDNTGSPNELPDSALADPDQSEWVKELSKALESGGSPDEVARKLASDENFQKLLRDSRLSSVQKYAGQKQGIEQGVSGLLQALDQAKRGELRSIPSSEIGLALAAIGELGNLAGEASDRLKGAFKGRNIRAHVGDEITLYVKNEVTVQVPTGPK